jgi:hypothetical protein
VTAVVEPRDHLELGEIEDLPRPLPKRTLSAAFGIVVVAEIAEFSRLIRPDSMWVGADLTITLGAVVFLLGAVYTLGRNFIGLGTSWIVDEADGTCEQIIQTMFRRHIVRVHLKAVREVITERSYNGLILQCASWYRPPRSRRGHYRRRTWSGILLSRREASSAPGIRTIHFG